MDGNNDVGLSDARVYEVEHPTFTRDMGGDIVQLSDGRLLYAFAPLPGGPGGILCCDSTDEGANWSEPRILIPAPEGRFSHPNGEGIGAPGFLRRRDGKLMLSFIWFVGDRDPWGHTYFRLSDDEGETWSDPKVLTPGWERVCFTHNNKLMRLTSGRILVPAEIQVDVGLGNDHRGFVSAVWHSDDGHSWHRSANVVNLLDQAIEAQEPHLVELRDGRTLMLFRTYSGYVGRAYSDDQGESWSSGELVEELRLPTNSSALHVSRIPSSGDLLLIRSTGDGGVEPDERPRLTDRLTAREHPIRTPLTSVISKDDGRSWSNERVIAGEPYGDYGYPSVLHLQRVTLVTYHALDGLHVARIPAGWFYGQG